MISTKMLLPGAEGERTIASRETSLLLWCARTNVDASTRERIASVLEAGVDWPAFVALASTHQVLPLVAATLCKSAGSACPPAIAHQLEAAVRLSVALGLRAGSQLRAVIDLVESEGIPVIPYKGPLLAIVAYGGAHLREFIDLDLWVHRWDFHRRIPQLLAARNWTCVSDFGFQRSFGSPEGDLLLDVHQSLTHPRWMPFSMSFGRIYERCETVGMAGSGVRTLRVPDLLIVLCVQLAKDAAEPRPFLPLIKACDIAELLRRHPGLDWNAILREARTLGVVKMLRVGVAVAARLLGAPLPEELQRAARTWDDLEVLVRHVQERIVGVDARAHRRPDLRDPRTWNSAVRERFRDRRESLVPLLRFALTPNRADYAFIRLPRAWDPLYPLVKPVRLAAKYGRIALGMRPDGESRS